MAYLTKSNSLKIITSNDFKSTGDLDGDVYKKPIYFFSTVEKNRLIGLQKLFEDPDKFIGEYYIPIKTEDKFQYVFEGNKPAFHNNSQCERLNSNYINFRIPDEIRERGKDEVIKFRAWFKSNHHLMEKPDLFVERLRLAFDVQVSPKSIERDNSGVQVKENLDLPTLEQRIDDLISEAGQYYKNSPPTKQEIIKRFQKYTFLAYSKSPLTNNNTKYSDEVIKAFLKQYDIHFKRPLKDLLIEYYRVKLNPELKFDGTLLEQLGFSACQHCHNGDFLEV
jgi:hypothetical protein